MLEPIYLLQFEKEVTKSKKRGREIEKLKKVIEILVNEESLPAKYRKHKTYTTNFSNWENPEYIKLLDRSFCEEADKRLHTLEQAEKIFLEDMPFIITKTMYIS